MLRTSRGVELEIEDSRAPAQRLSAGRLRGRSFSASCWRSHRSLTLRTPGKQFRDHGYITIAALRKAATRWPSTLLMPATSFRNSTEDHTSTNTHKSHKIDDATAYRCLNGGTHVKKRSSGEGRLREGRPVGRSES